MKKNYVIVLASLINISQLIAQPGITCNPNTFWGFNAGQIEEWEINGTNITSNGIIVTSVAPGNSIAFCDNLGGGTFSPTFYSHTGSNAAYFDGTAWVTDPAVSNCPLSNSAGASNYLYYNIYGNACLDKYDGVSFTQIYSNLNLKSTIADLAVDDAGNAWCLMGAATPNTDSIMVISPTGQVIKQYAFSMNTNNGYGCFLLNAILYVGLGGANPLYPNTLLPISFTSTAAVPGTPLSFTSLSFDLASCNAGTPLSISQNNPAVYDNLVIYPNIVSDYLICQMIVKINSTFRLSVNNTLSELIYLETLPTSNLKLETKIDLRNFSKGIYFITIDNGTEKKVRKFLKE